MNDATAPDREEGPASAMAELSAIAEAMEALPPHAIEEARALLERASEVRRSIAHILQGIRSLAADPGADTDI